MTVEYDVLEYRRELMVSKLAVWQETKDPCDHGHVEHTAADHLGRRLVHSVSHGFGADWDYDAVLEFIRTATAIGAAIEGERKRSGHIGVKGADGSVMGFECVP